MHLLKNNSNSLGAGFWDERYSSDKFIYGTEPNKFLKYILKKITPGKILFLGEGEGRNAVYAAKLGWNVDAVDFSHNARNKALKLAKLNEVKINYKINDLEKYKPKTDYYDAAVIIYLHLNQTLSADVFSKVKNSLKPNGQLILEVFEKEQIKNNSGGPKNVDALYSLQEIRKYFEEIAFITLKKHKIILNESEFHKGNAAVIQGLGKKLP